MTHTQGSKDTVKGRANPPIPYTKMMKAAKNMQTLRENGTQ